VVAFPLTPVQEYMAYKLGASELYLLGYSAVFLVIMLLLPRGIIPSLSDLLARRRRVTEPPAGAGAVAGPAATTLPGGISP
jgi:branched-chain amino acid transport system permease protein